jgi:hypothetical protein
MATLAEIRQQYPEYNDMSDQQLADSMYTKHYSDMPRDLFDLKVGYHDPQPKLEKTSATQAALMGAHEGAAFGFSDELAGLGAASGLPVGTPPLISAPVGAVRRLIGSDGAEEAYKAERDKFRSLNATAGIEHPIAHGSAEVAANVGASLSPLKLAGVGLKGAVAGGAALGALQGAGEADELGDVPTSAGIGAVTGGVVGAGAHGVVQAGKKLLSPFAASAPRQELVDTLTKEGVDVTAGQRSGSKPLKWFESAFGDLPLSGGKAAEISERQGEQFTSAALRRMGVDAPRATSEVIDDGVKRISQKFEDLSARNTLNYDVPLAKDLGAALQKYDDLIPKNMQAPMLAKVIDGIVAQGRSMPGQMYQAVRSAADKSAKEIEFSNPPLAGALKDVRRALDKAMNRSISSADRQEWETARRQWANWKTLEKAVTGAGAETAQGLISPQQLRTAVATANRGAYARGKGEMADLARAGAAIMEKLPNSGTAPRAFVQHAISAGAGAAAGGAADGPRGAGAGAVAFGLAGPGLAGRLLLSGPVQKALGNRLADRITPQQLGILNAVLASPVRQRLLSSSGDPK